MASMLLVREELERRVDASNVLPDVARRAARAHVRRAIEELRRVDARESRRQHANWREHTEPPTAVGRNVQGGDLLAACDGAQGSLLRMGDEDEPLLSLLVAQHV